MYKIFLIIICTTMILFSTEYLNETETDIENIISLNQQESNSEFENNEEAESIEEICLENELLNEVINDEQLVEEKEKIKVKSENESKKTQNTIVTQKQATNTSKEEKKNVTNENTSNKINNSVSEKTNTNKTVEKEEEKTTSNLNEAKANNSYKEYEVTIAKKTQCDGNNHKITSGNTGKWFDTQAQADNYYNQELEKWGRQWETGKIKKDEYLKKCPSGYETWSCPQCQKWTLNFYYR